MADQHRDYTSLELFCSPAPEARDSSIDLLLLAGLAVLAIGGAYLIKKIHEHQAEMYKLSADQGQLQQKVNFLHSDLQKTTAMSSINKVNIDAIKRQALFLPFENRNDVWSSYKLMK